jgi:hypothetical protein
MDQRHDVLAFGPHPDDLEAAEPFKARARDQQIASAIR